jgi:RimJ/RimL family protein N-acetyltransferase
MPWAREPTLAGSLELTARDEQAWREDLFFHFAVIEKDSDLALGIVGLNREGREPLELHYWIRTDRAGRGLATEAARALIEWAGDELHAPRLKLWAGRENHASRRVAEKLGFVHSGSLGWRPEGGLGDFPAESYELVLRPG